MLVDTHAHLNFNAYKADADEVIRRSLENGSAGSPQVWIINVGSQYKTSKRAIELAGSYEKGVYAAVGLHPIHLSKGIFKTKIDKEEIEFETQEEEFNYEKYRELAKSSKVVAIGEIGLDYYYRPKTKIKLEQFKNKQKEAFLKQLDLARDLNLPVIFHCRMAHQDLIETISNFPGRLQADPPKGCFPISKPKGVIHCFTGSWEQAKRYLEMGFHLGFNGIIFKLNLDEVIQETPLDRILIETDCPYLTPPPMVGRNEPFYVKYIAERIAKIKKISYEKIAEITTQNAKELFKI